jgi:hypothetical protein
MQIELTAFLLVSALASYKTEDNPFHTEAEQYQYLLQCSQEKTTNVYQKLLLKELNEGNFDYDKLLNLETEIANMMRESSSYQATIEQRVAHLKNELEPVFKANQAARAAATPSIKVQRKDGTGQLLGGIGMLALGIMLSVGLSTSTTTRYFYGLMLAGLVSIVAGLVNMFTED